ncbi:MAG: nucleotide exchange factor GrpE [Desulfovibrionaceae bacterium]
MSRNDNKEYEDGDDFENVQEMEELTKDVLEQSLLEEEIKKKRHEAMQNVEKNHCTQEDFEGERLRMLAEMENFKKRLRKEQEEQSRYATERVILSILPSLDNLSLALQYGKTIESAKDFYMGVEMTQKLLLESISQFGVDQVGVAGEEFSPDIHEAVTMEKREGVEANIVIEVLQVGYKLKERTIRPAKVIISQ